MKNFYDLLSVAHDAPPEDIKKAFRREIARYHPDKVQHLGPEFQDMAAGIAADLTEAYRILMDLGLRAKYDADLQGTAASLASRSTTPPSAASPAEPPRQPPAPPPVDAPPAAAPRADIGVDFIRRAAMSKIRRAIDEVIGASDPLPTRGFDIAVVAKGKKGLFRKAEDSVCLLVRFVPAVDPGAIAAVWPEAARVNGSGASGCVLMLIGSGLSPAKELAAAVSEQRRRSRGGGPVLVPVDVRDWEALFPPETPASVRSLIQRLKDEKR